MFKKSFKLIVGKVRASGSNSEDYYIKDGGKPKRWFRTKEARQKVIDRDYKNYKIMEV